MGITAVHVGDNISAVGVAVLWRLFSTVGDNVSTVGDSFSTVGGIQYIEGYLQYMRGITSVLWRVFSTGGIFNFGMFGH